MLNGSASVGYKRDVLNNIIGNGFFDKIFLKGFKLSNIFYFYIGSFCFQFSDFYFRMFFDVVECVYCLRFFFDERFFLYFVVDFKFEIDNFVFVELLVQEYLIFIFLEVEIWSLELVEK